MISVKFTAPEQLFDDKAFIATVIDEMNKVLDATKSDFDSTQATWSGKVAFRVERAHRVGDVIRGSVSTDDPKYVRINDGTPPRAIVSSGKIMKFRPGYGAKTTPGRIGSGGATRSGPVLHRRAVKLHSIKAREFDVAIAKKRENDLLSVVDAGVDAATK